MKQIILLSILLLSGLAFAGDYVAAGEFGKEPVVPQDAIPGPAAGPKCSIAPIIRWSGIAVAATAGGIAVWQNLRVSSADKKRADLETERAASLESSLISNSEVSNLVSYGYDAAIDNQKTTADEAKTARTISIVLASLGLVGFGLSYAF